MAGSAIASGFGKYGENVVGERDLVSPRVVSHFGWNEQLLIGHSNSNLPFTGILSQKFPGGGNGPKVWWFDGKSGFGDERCRRFSSV